MPIRRGERPENATAPGGDLGASRGKQGENDPITRRVSEPRLVSTIILEDQLLSTLVAHAHEIAARERVRAECEERRRRVALFRRLDAGEDVTDELLELERHAAERARAVGF